MPHTTDVLTVPIAELAKIKPELEADKPADKQNADEREEAERKQTYASVRAQYQYLVRQWLATFAFALEANSRSRCESPPNRM